MLCVNPEEGETNDGSGNAGSQIDDIFHAVDGQHCWPYDDGSEQDNEYGRDIAVVCELDKLVEMPSYKCA